LTNIYINCLLQGKEKIAKEMAKSLSGNDDSDDFETMGSECSDFGQADSENSDAAADIITGTSNNVKSKKNLTDYKYKEKDSLLKENNLVAVTHLSGPSTSTHNVVNSPSSENTSESLPIISKDAVLYSNVDTNHTNSYEKQDIFLGKLFIL